MSILSFSNKIVRRSIRTSLFLVVMFQMACIGGVCLCNAAEVDCDQLLSNEALQQYDFDKEQIKKMQISLAALGYDPEKMDGTMGQKTIVALQRFCDDFKTERTENFAGDLAATLFHYAAIAMEDPDGNKRASGNNTPPDDEETGVAPSPEASEDGPPDTESLQEAGEDGSPDTESVQKAREDGLGVVYQLTEEDVGELTDTGVPESVMERLKELQDVEYENDNLFKKALVVKDDLLIVNYADQFKTYKLTEQFFVLLTDAGVSVDIITELRELQNKEYASKNALLSAVQTKIEEATGEYRALIVEKARKEHEYDTSKSINWSGGSCGCVLDDLSGVVYGFYPFWLAGDEQQLDFSVLSRIGYYALSFDDKGDIPETLHWDSEKVDFIKEAHIYRTKVDLVIYKNDWKKWSQFTAEKKLDIMDKATTNIVHLVNMTLKDYFSRIKPYISFGTSSSPTMGDGVTLYFDGYPTDDDSMYFLITFIEQLKSKLHTNGSEHFLNMMLMLPKDELSRVVQKLEEAEVVIEDKKAKAVNFYLVFLEEPTSDNKKKLRQTIEDNFKGLARRNILRKIIPVITFAGHDEQKLRDDFIYFEDNFGGVGFWPLPISTDNGADDAGKIIGSAAEVVNNALTALYQKEDGKPVSSIFKFVCPNRWAFRIIWDIFTAILLVSIVLYFTVCEWRALFMKCFLYFILGVVLPWFLLSLFLLYYDPFWKKTAEGNTPLILVVLGIISYVLWKYFKKKKEAELP